ncbi:hypothetical protein C8R44DRAFT_862159 [Mycena epipterygia]|nr:hypothetical protein C8R44DRAFT_862159 [Mycena epipterygia]
MSCKNATAQLGAKKEIGLPAGSAVYMGMHATTVVKYSRVHSVDSTPSRPHFDTLPSILSLVYSLVSLHREVQKGYNISGRMIPSEGGVERCGWYGPARYAYRCCCCISAPLPVDGREPLLGGEGADGGKGAAPPVVPLEKAFMPLEKARLKRSLESHFLRRQERPLD